VDQLIDFLRSLGPFSPVLVYFSATAESAGFIGLFVPGELLTLVGGAIAGLGETPLVAVMLAAVAGAITGDSIGYWIGHRFGGTLLDRPALRRARPAFDKAGRFLEEHRRWSLVVARFTPMIRSLIPMAAGASQMPYRTFVVPNAVGGILWGVSVSSLGFWAGARWEAIEETFQQGMWMFTALMVLTVTATAGGRWIAHHRSRVRLAVARLGDRPVVGPVVRLLASSWGQPRPFLRLIPHATILIGTVAILSASALVDLSFPEARIVSWLENQISDRLAHGLSAASAIFELPLVVGTAVMVSIAMARARTGRLVALATTLSAAIALLIAAIGDRNIGWIPPEWRIDGADFPDLRTAVVVPLVIGLAWPWTEDWAAATRRLGLGAAVTLALVAVAVGAHTVYPFDALAGAALGAISIVLTTTWLDPRVRECLRVEPDGPEPSTLAHPSVPAPERPPI
jgi:membrane protein DedA with SNARE-associated domain